MSAEEVIYQDGAIVITPTRAVFGDKAFAIGHITSVTMADIPPSLTVPCVFFAIGAALIGVGVLAAPIAFLGSNAGDKLLLVVVGVLVVIGVALLAVGVGSMVSTKPTYAVKIGSASGEARAMVSPSKDRVEKIVDAMNEAIVKRG